MQLVHIVSQRKDDGSEQCIAATDALLIYGGIDANQKSKFLNDFRKTKVMFSEFAAS